MFKDSLQKRLQKMERESPSPSLENVKPTLKERAGFLGRYVTFKVSKVPQKDHIYGSLEDEVRDQTLESKFRTAEYFIRSKLDNAMRYARAGKGPIEGALQGAYERVEDVWQSVEVPAKEVREIKKLYSEQQIENAESFIRSKLDNAMRYARAGEGPIEGALQCAYERARISGVEIPEQEVNAINRKFKERKCETAPTFIKEKLANAMRYARAGEGPIEGALQCAYERAEEFGLEIDESEVAEIRRTFNENQRNNSGSLIASKIENIRRYISTGNGPVDGALIGAKEVAYKTGAQLPTNL